MGGPRPPRSTAPVEMLTHPAYTITVVLGGISGDCQNPDNPHYGLWRFKHGFGGYMKEFVGEFDYVINKPIYKLYNIATKVLEKVRK